jgi:hypothetical protein
MNKDCSTVNLHDYVLQNSFFFFSPVYFSLSAFSYLLHSNVLSSNTIHGNRLQTVMQLCVGIILSSQLISWSYVYVFLWVS